MKRALLIVASLALGTAAIAQDQPAATPAGPESQGAPGANNPGAPPPATAPGSDPGAASAPAPSDVTSPSPGAANPSSGTAPTDAGSAPTATAGGDTSSYPKCGKGVTDKCVQAGGAGGHKRMAHKPRHK